MNTDISIHDVKTALAVSLAVFALVGITGCNQDTKAPTASTAPTVPVAVSQVQSTPAQHVLQWWEPRTFNQMVHTWKIVQIHDALGIRNFYKFKFKDSSDGRIYACILPAELAVGSQDSSSWEADFSHYATDTSKKRVQKHMPYQPSEDQRAAMMAEVGRVNAASNITLNTAPSEELEKFYDYGNEAAGEGFKSYISGKYSNYLAVYIDKDHNSKGAYTAQIRYKDASGTICRDFYLHEPEKPINEWFLTSGGKEPSARQMSDMNHQLGEMGMGFNPAR
jgi:hypothetical protein